MNYTKSGALAVGSPGSLARIAAEAKQARENQYHLLLLTEEGRDILRRFAVCAGCAEAVVESPDVGEWINKEYSSLFRFLCAIEFAFSKV